MKTGIFYRSILTGEIKHLDSGSNESNVDFAQDQRAAKMQILRETEDSASGAVLTLIQFK